MSEIVVSNAGPLMVFSKLNLLYLLEEVYGEIFIPQAVYEETVINGIKYSFEDAHTIKLFLEQSGWKIEKSSKIPEVVNLSNLDKGEKEAIGLALYRNGLLLMDEEAGRSIARDLGLKIKGSLGILIQAYNLRLITFERLRFYFIQISSRKDIWISPKLCDSLLEHFIIK